MEFEKTLKERTLKVNSIIEDFLPEADNTMYKRIMEAMRYSVSAGGKRLRPVLMLEAYRLCGGKSEHEVYPFMVALEFIHTYSLVHDDLPAMDNDDYRRGKLTTHKVYGEDFGVLAGDGLLNYAYEVMTYAVASSAPENIRKAARAAQTIARKAGVFGMVGGQSLDVWLTDKPMNESELDFIFNLKTGALIEAAFMAGGILAGAGETVVEKLEKAGNLVGVAFQIKDDILDVTSTQEVLGKPVFSDEKNNKTTDVTLYGMERASSDVARMSEAAKKLVKEIGDNPFLVELINKLINREK